MPDTICKRTTIDLRHHTALTISHFVSGHVMLVVDAPACSANTHLSAEQTAELVRALAPVGREGAALLPVGTKVMARALGDPETVGMSPGVIVEVDTDDASQPYRVRFGGNGPRLWCFKHDVRAMEGEEV
jgi:hypothetical protein